MSKTIDVTFLKLFICTVFFFLYMCAVFTVINQSTGLSRKSGTEYILTNFILHKNIFSYYVRPCENWPL